MKLLSAILSRTLVSVAVLQTSVGPALAQVTESSNLGKTRTPIKHVIVIIGENRSFDHVFATYVPKKPGETVNNLLSQGIITLNKELNAVPGPNFGKAHQLAASDLGSQDPFLLDPPKMSFPRDQLPAPLAGGASGVNGYFTQDAATGEGYCYDDGTKQSLDPVDCAMASEQGLPRGGAYYDYLASGGTGLPGRTPDTRIAHVNSLPAGPFQLTNEESLDYNAYAASPVHRFYQMWQQENCSAERVTAENGSGCSAKLFAWVEVTVGAGANGLKQPPNFSTEYSPAATTTGEGATALGFYNVQRGDVPYFTSLVERYAMSDNFHQSVNGGTGANHIMFGHGDALWFSDANGQPAVPPENKLVFNNPGNPNAGVVNEIENPNPQTNTNNWYSQDGYGGGGFGSPVFGGGSYSDCSDLSQPGVAPIVNYLRSLPRPVAPRCEKGHYYLLNNYNPGWFGDGTNAYTDHNAANTPFTIPPSSTPSIGDDLNRHNISWKYYGDQWNNYLPDKYQANYGTNGPQADEYCNICNPFQYDTSIMSHPAQVKAHMGDVTDLYADIGNDSLPAVSIVKPSGYVDGHPASSKLNLFEGFTKKIVDMVARSRYADDTAIFITFDEGGGYYDSGYVQPVDFFGDGTRIPLIVVSQYAKPGHISHAYSDHVSILKFIERNWDLPPVTRRSRDNFPNPVTARGSPYVPLNTPALDDLFDLFAFN